jgi:UrcA family protein
LPHPRPAPTAIDHHTRHHEFRGVRFEARGLVVNELSYFNAFTKEIHMYIKRVFMSAWPVLAAAIIACAFFAGDVAAKDVKVSYQVSAQGLDLNQPAGASEFYTRIRRAAQIVCTHGMRVDLAPSADPQGCYEKALGDAVRSAHVPLVTDAYLATHTLQQAAARGIVVPVQVAAK